MMDVIDHQSYRWLSARLQYLQCVSHGVTTVLRKAIDTKTVPTNVTTFRSLLLNRGLHATVFTSKSKCRGSGGRIFSLARFALLLKRPGSGS